MGAEDLIGRRKVDRCALASRSPTAVRGPSPGHYNAAMNPSLSTAPAVFHTDLSDLPAGLTSADAERIHTAIRPAEALATTSSTHLGL